MTEELILRNLNEEPRPTKKGMYLPVFRRIEVIFVLISIGSYILDTGTDLALVYFYYIAEDYWYFGLTLGFVIISSLSMTAVSLYWYLIDESNKEVAPVSTVRWVFRTVFLLLQLGPIMRYIESLDAGWRTLRYKDRGFLMLWAYEDSDATMLRLLECFMEAVPQLVLQLNIMVRKAEHQFHENASSMMEDSPTFNHTELVTESSQTSEWFGDNSTVTVLLQVLSVLASWTSVCWALVASYNAERTAHFHKPNLSKPALVIYLVWRLGTVGARVLALGLFASIYPLWLAVICGVNWIMMSAWFIWQKTDVCGNKCAELGFDFIVGFINIFCFFKVKDERTRYKYVIYYSWKFCENSVLIFIWFSHANPQLWFYYPAIIGHYLGFFIGLAFMILYYTKFHPSVKVKLPCTS